MMSKAEKFTLALAGQLTVGALPTSFALSMLPLMDGAEGLYVFAVCMVIMLAGAWLPFAVCSALTSGFYRRGQNKKGGKRNE